VSRALGCAGWGVYGCIFSWRFHAESENVII
jgi:hypothetical protein